MTPNDRPNKGGRPRVDEGCVKTTISLTAQLFSQAYELARQQGFANNFSQYIASLIRKDWDVQREKEARLEAIRQGKLK